MNTSLLLQVRFGAERLHVQASVRFSVPHRGDLTFSLAEGLQVTAVHGEGKSLPFAYGAVYSPQFCCASRPVTVSVPEELSQLKFSYEGTISGAVSIMMPALRAINFYSAWYPFDCPELPENARIEVFAKPEELLLKGTFKSESSIWVYGEEEEFDPFNLILINRERCFLAETDGGRVCCREEREIPSAKAITVVFQDILNYYSTDLYRPSKTLPEVTVPPIDIISLSVPNLGGAYFRRGLIVMDCIREDNNATAALLAHELGHTWGSGAGWDWEDWLNETVAEWSCLCYLLERKGSVPFMSVFVATPKSVGPIRRSVLRTAAVRKKASMKWGLPCSMESTGIKVCPQ